MINDVHRLATLVAPRGVAVVGASATRPGATGNQVLRNMRAAGFAGHVDVVSRAGGSVEGVESVYSSALDPSIDVAVVAVAPHAVMTALKELHDADVPAAIVMSVGLTLDQRNAVRGFVDTSGMLVHGPNCMGVINVHDDVMLWADEGILTNLPAGSVSLVSQSGSGAIFVARSMTGVGFAHVISTGNETTTTTADYLRFLATDDRTEVVGVILESIADADDFADAVRELRANGKTIVAMKVGRSTAGAQATIAHTGAVLADDAIASAFFDHIDVPLVADYDELASSLELLAHCSRRDFGHAKVSIVTISGGQAALAADLADTRNVTLAPLTNKTRVLLSEVLPGAHITNPLDTGGSAYAGEDYFSRSLDLLSDDSSTDVVLVISDSQRTLNEVEIAYEDELVSKVKLAARRSSKPFVIASSSSVSLHASRETEPDGSVPVIRGIGNALTAIRAAATATRPVTDLPARFSDLPSPAVIAQYRAKIARTAGALDGDLTRELLEEYGLPFVTSLTTASVDEAVRWAARTGFPVVAKVSSPDISHRSDIGGVVTDVGDENALRAAWLRITEAIQRHAPHARLAGIEVQRQIVKPIEAFVGALSDPQMGATVGVGLGGVLVELLGDVAHALAPLTPDEARKTLESTALHRLLDGYRGLYPRLDTAPLIDMMVRVSWLMKDFAGLVTELDLNPVLVDSTTGRVMLVDALAVTSSAPAETTTHDERATDVRLP